MTISRSDIRGALTSGTAIGDRLLPTWLSPGMLSSWPYADVTVAAEDLRHCLIAAKKPDPRGLILIGLVIQGDLDLHAVQLGFPLAMIGCHFLGTLDLQRSRLRSIALRGSVLHATGRSLIMDGAEIDSEVNARGIHAVGELSFRSTKIGSHLDISDSELRSPYRAFSGDELAVEGSLYAERMRAKGTVRATGAKVGADLDLDGAVLRGAGVAFGGDRIEVGGMFTAVGLRAFGTLRLIGGQFKSGVALVDAVLGHDGDSLTADRLSVSGSFIADRLMANGDVRLLGVKIGGQLSLAGATFDGPEDSLSADAISVAGDANMPNIHATGCVRLVGAQFASALNLNGATLDGAPVSLMADATRVDGSVFAGRVTATGEVRLLGAQLTRQSIFRGARLHWHDRSFSADGARFGGNLVLEHVHARGSVCLPGAQMGAQMDLDGAHFNDSTLSLDLSDVAVAQTLFLRPQRCDSIKLDNISVGTLVVSEFASQLPGLSDSTGPGWQVGSVYGCLERSARDVDRWLAPISAAQPWQAISSTYENNGHPAEAKRLRFLAATRSTKTLRRARRLGRILYQLSAGYGYYPSRAVLMLGIVFLLALCISLAAATSFTTRATPIARTDIIENHATIVDGRTVPGRLPASWWDSHWDIPEFNPVLYATTVAVPAIASESLQPWNPPEGPLIYFFMLLKGISWILSALLLAATTGLLRRST